MDIANKKHLGMLLGWLSYELSTKEFEEQLYEWEQSDAFLGEGLAFDLLSCNFRETREVHDARLQLKLWLFQNKDRLQEIYYPPYPLTVVLRNLDELLREGEVKPFEELSRKTEYLVLQVDAFPASESFEQAYVRVMDFEGDFHWLPLGLIHLFRTPERTYLAEQVEELFVAPPPGWKVDGSMQGGGAVFPSMLGLYPGEHGIWEGWYGYEQREYERAKQSFLKYWKVTSLLGFLAFFDAIPSS